MSEKRKGRKRKRVVFICLGLLTTLMLVTGGAAWCFRDEIKAFVISRQYSTADLEQQLTDNVQIIDDAVKASPDITVRVPTEEERQALKDGSLAQEDLIDRLTAPAVPTPIEPETPKVPETTSQETAPAEQPVESTEMKSDYQEQLSKLVARVYVLREKYLNELDAMERAAKADYRALPESQRTNKKLASLVNDYLSRGVDLENACDDQMDEIVAEMQTLIKENNGDMSLIDTVIYSYANEKSIKKAWYMSRLEEKGLI